MPILSSDRLDPPASNDAILDAFLSYLIEAGIEPYAHQESAILELYAGHNVILNTPTGSGKSLVAMAVQFLLLFLRHGRRFLRWGEEVGEAGGANGGERQ